MFSLSWFRISILVAMTASVAKELLCFVHKQVAPSLQITVSAQSLSQDDQRGSQHEEPAVTTAPFNVTGCVGDVTESLPVYAKMSELNKMKLYL